MTPEELEAELSGYDPEAIEHLASLLRARADTKRRQLAEIAGKPTVGWFRRHGQPRPTPPPAPRMKPEQVTRLAAGMVADGFPEEIVAQAVVELATGTGTAGPAAIRAAARGVLMGRQRRSHAA